MKRLVALIGTLVLLACAHAEEPAPSPALQAHGWSYTEMRRIAAAEARQGVAVDDAHVYAIDNRTIGKYLKRTGERVALWQDQPGGPFIHLNAGVVHSGRLYCAHSNYPDLPMVSSVEVWDTASLRHVESHSFGRTDGSLTWIDRRGDRWLACFAHYGKKGGEPGRGPEWTRIVEFDDAWRELRGWALPVDLIAHIGGRGYSCSGGAIGPDGHLYVTGHDNPELYVLSFPSAGGTLRWIASIPVSMQGQASAWDRSETGMLFGVNRRTREVLIGRIVIPPAPAG